MSSKTSVTRTSFGASGGSAGQLLEGDYTHRGNFSVVGNMACRSFSMLSDGTSKSHIKEVPAEVYLSSLNVPLKTWRWSSGADTSPHVGFISQDVREIGPLSAYEIVQRKEIEEDGHLTSKLFLKTEEFNFLRTEALKHKAEALELELAKTKQRLDEVEEAIDQRDQLLDELELLLEKLRRPNCLRRFCQWLWN